MQQRPGSSFAAFLLASGLALALVSCGQQVSNPPQAGFGFGLDSGAAWIPPGADAAADGGTPHASDGSARTGGDAAPVDSAAIDTAATDTAATDTATVDTATPDVPGQDGGLVDVSSPDTTAPDAGEPDAGTVDAGTPDAYVDAVTPDAADVVADAGTPDVGLTDAGPPDSGVQDTWTGPLGADVPWGSESDVPPFDAGQWEYDIKDGGGTAGSGPGLCAPHMGEVNIEKKVTGGKADIIIFVDTSGSMGQETKWVQAQLNNFANYLNNANIDFVLVVIEKDTGCCKLCIQPPLGGPGCQNNPPKFIHNKTPVYSKDGLSKFVQSYPQWKQWLRPDATKNIIAVTDDNASQKNPWFEQQIDKINLDAAAQGQPVQFVKTAQVPFGFVFHSIVAYPTKAQCNTMASLGSVYLELTAKTNGAQHKICLQDWTPIFKSLANAVSQTAKPGCTYPMKKPAGVSSASDLIISYHDGKSDFDVAHVKSNNCPANGIGFVFDNVANPTQVTICPTSCGKLAGGGDLLFHFGCM